VEVLAPALANLLAYHTQTGCHSMPRQSAQKEQWLADVVGFCQERTRPSDSKRLACTLLKRIPQVLKAAREKLGKEPEDIGTATGYAAKTIKSFENGSRLPNFRVFLTKLLPQYRLDLQQLLCAALAIDADGHAIVPPSIEAAQKGDRLEVRLTKRASGVDYAEVSLPGIKCPGHTVALIELLPQETHGGEGHGVRHRHVGEEFLYVQEGTLTMQLEGPRGDEHIQLEEGEGLIFKAHRLHQTRNDGADAVRYLAVRFPAHEGVSIIAPDGTPLDPDASK